MWLVRLGFGLTGHYFYQGGGCLEDILKKDGLSFELLEVLSYRSELGIRLKKNLHYFDK